MGDDGGLSVKEGMGQIMNALDKQYPWYTQQYANSIDPLAQAETDVTTKYSPQYANAAANIFDNQGRALAKTGREINAADVAQAGQNELALATGSGAQLAKQALDLQKVADPEYFSNRTALSDNIAKMMSAIDPSKLSSGEQEQIARGLGRTNYAVGSPMQTVSNAMTFGDALAKRREEFGRALDRQSAAMPALRSGVNMFGAATQRAQAPNAGLSQLPGLQTPGLNTSQNLWAQYMSPASAAMQIKMQKEKSDWDKYNMGVGAVGNTLSVVGKVAGGVMGGMCWIARAAFGENNPRWLMFRHWLAMKSPLWFYNWYRDNGETVAAWLNRNSWAKPFVRFMMNLVLPR